MALLLDNPPMNPVCVSSSTSQPNPATNSSKAVLPQLQKAGIKILWRIEKYIIFLVTYCSEYFAYLLVPPPRKSRQFCALHDIVCYPDFSVHEAICQSYEPNVSLIFSPIKTVLVG